MEEYEKADKFDLIILATKARDALDVAPFLARLLSADGTLLPIQNGCVSQLLFDRFGDKVVGGLSNLGATMLEPGVYKQKNAGHLLIGELAGGLTERVARILHALKGGIELKATPNFSGAMWAKLLLNCSVTTTGAVAGQTMRHYIATSAGLEVFRNAYDEALRIALAAGVRPERMIVEPMPPGWDGARSSLGTNYDAWLEKIIATYGDLKPSMLQDFERGRRTEIDFINGYVAQLGEKMGVSSPLNAAIAETVHLIEQGHIQPGSVRMEELARRCASINEDASEHDEAVVRRFQPGDEAAFHDLNEAWILESFSMDEKDKQILGDPSTYVLKPGGEIFFIVRSGSMLGCCALLPLGDRSWEVAKMAVAKGHRGRGLGRHLLSSVIEHAKTAGAGKICLKTSSILHPAIHLYKSMGFQIVAQESSTLSRNARADVFMELLL